MTRYGKGRLWLLGAVILGASVFRPAGIWAQTVTDDNIQSDFERLEDPQSERDPPGESGDDFGIEVIEEETGLGSEDLRVVVARLINIALGFLGIIFLLLLLSSGFLLLTSGGKEEKIDQAKKTFFNAVIGLFIILTSSSIVRFVLSALGPATNTGTTPPL